MSNKKGVFPEDQENTPFVLWVLVLLKQ